MATNTSKGRKPDFHIFSQSGDDAPLVRIGAAWKHGKGDGFSIRFDALPVNGQAVAFPPKEDAANAEEADFSYVLTCQASD